MAMIKKSAKGKKILLTGGHAALSAMAVIEEIIRQSNSFDLKEIFWVGPKSAFEGKNIATIDSIFMPRMGVKHYRIIAGKIGRKLNLWNLISVVKIPLGFVNALWLLGKLKPDAVLSFGGYVALPVVFGAWLKRIPVLIHEQTVTVGRANLISARFARMILLAREESRQFFRNKKTLLVGNPIMTQMTEITPKSKPGKPPTILVTGGSRGSTTLNLLIESCLNKLLQTYNIIHQTGPIDFEKFQKIKSNLPEVFAQKYEVFDLVDPMKRDNVFRQADIVIARAGAHTVSDIIATIRPAVLIPIPWSNYNEQYKNALYAKNLGIAEILNQDEADADSLMAVLNRISKNWEAMVKKTQKNSTKNPDINASARIVDILIDVINEN